MFESGQKVKVVENNNLWNALTDEGGWTEEQIREAVYIVTYIGEKWDEVEARCSELTTNSGLDGFVIGKAKDFALLEEN